MEITNAAFTTLFISAVYALINVVKYLINKKNGNGRVRLPIEQEEMLMETHETTMEMKRLHDVYDENHIPLWYIPREAVSLIKETHSKVEPILKGTETISTIQSNLIEKISDLITSQKILTERLGDVMANLNRTFKN